MVTQPAGVANEFAMTSEILSINIPDPQTSSATPAVSFLLERLSARIDIENETTTADGGEFVLEGARLVNAIDRSFLVKGQDPALTIGNTEYGALAIPTGNWITNSGVSGDMKKMYMNLYAYENVKNTLRVQVKGTFKGQPAQFDLPFGEHAVKRNFRYVVKIKNVAGNKVNFEIKVRDWEEGGNITIKPGLDGAKPKITKIAPATATGATAPNGHTLAYSTGSNPNDANVITLTNPTVYYTKITVESESTEAALVVNKTEVPWISIKELGQSNIAGGKLVQEFLVTYAPTQDLYGRTAELELQNKFKPNKADRHLITVKQPKAATSTNHLAHFANANVGELNTFADAITPDNLTDYDNLGKYYQWGRNVSFSYGTLITTTATKSNGNDARLWSDEFITATASPFTWEATPLGDNWEEVVSKATNAPTSYKGTNNGDPCPAGYRLPKKEEFMGILPYADATNINFKGSVNKKGVAETITINGASAAYTADYYSDRPNVIYALKMKDATNANLTAYRYEYKGAKGLWVTSRLLGAAGAATTVEQVIRYFPAMGYLSRANAASGYRGSYGYGWASESRYSSLAWGIGFYSSSPGVSSSRKAYAFTVRPFRP